MQDVGSSEGIDSRTPFFCVHIKPILGTHLLAIKNAIFFLKSFTLHAHNPSKKFSFCLIGNLIDGITIHEGSFE